jgi:hypothetical protein
MQVQIYGLSVSGEGRESDFHAVPSVSTETGLIRFEVCNRILQIIVIQYDKKCVYDHIKLKKFIPFFGIGG